MRSIDLRELQLIELDILKKVASVCDAHAIRYYLAGGTLLGAVRHQGFIPWDDDIDLLMPRPDYERFIELLKSGVLKEGYTYASLEMPHHWYPFLKVYKYGTLAIENRYDKAHCQSMIWIDIFPMDGLPSSVKSIKRMYRFTKQLRNFLYAGIVEASCFPKSMRVGIALARPFSKLIGAHRIAKLIDWIARRYDFEKEKLVGGIVWGYGPQEAMVKADYVPYVDLPFEDSLFHCPACWDDYLHALYGQYWTLPPEEKRRIHTGAYSVFS